MGLGMTAKVTPEAAEAVVRGVGYEPLEPYPAKVARRGRRAASHAIWRLQSSTTTPGKATAAGDAAATRNSPMNRPPR